MIIVCLFLNVREYRRGNHKYTYQRNVQPRVHKTKKHNTVCGEHLYAQTNTNNVNNMIPHINDWR